MMTGLFLVPTFDHDNIVLSFFLLLTWQLKLDQDIYSHWVLAYLCAG